VLWPALISEWELSPQLARWFDEREGTRCAWCRSSLRCAILAAAILQAVNARAGTTSVKLSALFDDPRTWALSVAEINSAGTLHRYLARSPGLRFSEFGSRDTEVPSENLMDLSYGSSTFDLVITSDTLEHVPDVGRALAETFRVLKPGGAHVFTVPLVWDRPTRQRALIDHGQVVHLLAPSYHGSPNAESDLLVHYEFGGDFLDWCNRAGFDVQVLQHGVNPAVVAFIAQKPN
jgi:SAM-dependent methyltransferase